MALSRVNAIEYFNNCKNFFGGFLKAQRENVYSTRYVACTCTCIGLTIIVGYYGYKKLSGRKNLPPGPWPLPALRTLLTSGSVGEVAQKWKETYGDIFRVKLGVRNMIFLTRYEDIQAALSDRKLQGRTDFFTFKSVTFDRNIGLINSEGEPWHTNRKFALKHLSHLGLGGNEKMQEYIMYEASMLLDYFEKSKGKPIVLGPAINVAVLNVLWNLVAGQRYKIDDADIMYFMDLMYQMVAIFEGPIMLLNMIPFLKHLPDFLLNKLGKKALLESRDKLLNFTMEEIKRHEASYSPTVANDFIDHYLAQIIAEKGLPGTVFGADKMNLAVTIIDLFFAGSETTSSTLKWFIYYMVKNPTEQEKIQASLDEFVPRPLTPSIADEENLVYLRAAIRETMRLSSLVPQGLPHVATEDTKLKGYDIPKGSIIMPCLEVCHRSEDYFERPDEFYPRHFINEEGKLQGSLGFMPFSVGPRRCIGESLAKLELLLITASLLQNFSITPGPNFEKYQQFAEGGGSLLNLPPTIEVVMTKRPL